MRVRVSVGVVLGLLFGAGGASAAVINIDFNTTSSPTYSGQGALADAGNNFWNGVQASPTNVALNSSANTATIVTVSTTASNNFDNTGGGSATSGTGVDLLRDYLFTGTAGETKTVTLSGLTAGQTYGLYLYGAGDQTNQATIFTVATASGNVSGSTGPVSSRAGFATPGNYTVLSNLSPTGSGNNGSLVITFTNNTGSGFGPFNGLQVSGTFVPEPASLGLLGIGGLGLLARRRRPASV